MKDAAFWVPIVVAAIGALFTQLRTLVQSRTKPGQVATVFELARQIVLAAEKLGTATGITGPDKYEYAETALISMAKKVGLSLKPVDANAIIHAVLQELDRLESFDNDRVSQLEALLEQVEAGQPDPVG